MSLHRLIRAAAAVTTAVTLATAPALVASATSGIATAAPAPAGPVAVALAGTENTRTFEAYRTGDGQLVRDLVLRSDNLSRLTPADQRVLTQRRLATIIDLRTGIERALQPDRPVPGAHTEVFDVLGATSPTTLVDLPSAYRSFVTDPGARRAFGNTLLEIKNVTATGRSVLFHCSAGKDRTGWTAAILLTILGVDRTTVERDFLASNTFRHASANDPLNGVNIAWLRTAFATANSTYGSFDNYVHRGLGLSPSDVAALKKNLLSTAPHTTFSVLRWGTEA